jgi:4-hydroxy-2-oxoheptanedioate aldolase
VNAFDLQELGEYLSQANDNTAVIIQIETLAAYKAVEQFANVEGVGTLPRPPVSLCTSPPFPRHIPTFIPIPTYPVLMVDVLFIGPFDLSNALGHPLAHGVEHPVLSEAIQKILDISHKAGKKAGIFTTSNEDARKRVEQGFDMVHIGTDVHLLLAGVNAGVNAAQGKTPGAAKGGY